MPPKAKKTPTSAAAAAASASVTEAQRTKDAMFIFDNLFEIVSPVTFNVAEIAHQTGAKANTVSKRFNIIRNRYPGLKISTTTSGGVAGGLPRNANTTNHIPPTPAPVKKAGAAKGANNTKGTTRKQKLSFSDPVADEESGGNESSIGSGESEAESDHRPTKARKRTVTKEHDLEAATTKSKTQPAGVNKNGKRKIVTTGDVSDDEEPKPKRKKDPQPTIQEDDNDNGAVAGTNHIGKQSIPSVDDLATVMGSESMSTTAWEKVDEDMKTSMDIDDQAVSHPTVAVMDPAPAPKNTTDQANGPDNANASNDVKDGTDDTVGSDEVEA